MGKEARLLGDRGFCLVAGSVGLSAFGDWVEIVALGLQIKELLEPVGPAGEAYSSSSVSASA